MMRTSRTAPILLALMVIFAFALVGCSKPRTTPPVTDVVEAPVPSTEATGTGEGAEPELLHAETTIGQAATAGPWTLTVLSAEVGDAYGSYQSDDGGRLLKLELLMINNTNDTASTNAADFTISDGESFAPALVGDSTYNPDVDVQAGIMTPVNVVFYVPNHLEPLDLEFVFQHATRSNITKILSTLK